MVSDTTTLSEIQVWRLYGLILVLLATVAAARGLPNHLLLAGCVASVAIGAMVAMSIFPLWSLVFCVGSVIGGIVAERSAQI
jgi:hypothetical protein